MKTALILTAAALITAVAPAATAQNATSREDTRFDPAATTFTGWVRVSNGEFQLYPQQRQLNQPFSRPCVSGALPSALQRTATDLTGNQVRFTGRAVDWDENKQNGIVRHEGSRIVNECGGDHVIEATGLTVLR